MKGFIEFVRDQGVVGLAVGFILGGAVSGLVSAIVEDVVNPILAIALGSTEGIESATFMFFGAEVMYGHLIGVFIDFLIIALVVYFGVKLLGLDKLDKKKS